MCAIPRDGVHPTTDKEIRSRLFALGWPAMLENFMQSAMFMINTALAGRLGAEALAGAGIADFTMFFVFGASAGATDYCSSLGCSAKSGSHTQKIIQHV